MADKGEEFTKCLELGPEVGWELGGKRVARAPRIMATPAGT